MNKKRSVMPPTKTRQELASELGISYTTLYRWLKKNQIDLPSGLISPQNVQEIYQKLGFPIPKEYQLDFLEP